MACIYKALLMLWILLMERGPRTLCHAQRCPGKKIALLSNHKTGTGYCQAVSRAAAPCIECVNTHADKKDIVAHEMMSHYAVDLIREPYALIASSYGYHCNCPEPWTKCPFSTYNSTGREDVLVQRCGARIPTRWQHMASETPTLPHQH